MNEQDHLSLAIRVAADAHMGQTYPSPEREPYILHPLRVMFAVGMSEPARVAAVLHDVVEDTDMTLADLGELGFALDVLHAVDCLTHQPGVSYEEYIDRVATDPTAVAVKLADLADNLANNRRLPLTDEVTKRMARYTAAQQRLTASR
jgi:(p)ppGpp synthase/HD superfamily hydrolase